MTKKRPATNKTVIRYLNHFCDGSREYDAYYQKLNPEGSDSFDNTEIFTAISDKYFSKFSEGPDYESLKNISWAIALWRYDREFGDHLEYLRLSHRCHLFCQLNEYVKVIPKSFDHFHVEILSSCCSHCSKANGKTMTINKFIDNPPIPQELCERGWCNCTFLLVDKDEL